MRLALVVVIVVAGCADHGLVPCGDLACPRGFVCTPAGCASPPQLAACEALGDGAACTAPGMVEVGVCIAGACWPSICGDGVVGPEEVCDDGNAVPGDGCSSDCRSAEVCGDEVVDPQIGEECDSGLAGRSSDGCASSCTVEFDLWADRSPSPIGAGSHLAMAYDAKRGVAILFGNVDGPAQTWEWNGVNWRRRLPPESPSARKDHALAYDPERERIVLFGGSDGGFLLGDTWEWDGTTWTERASIAPPVPRAGHAMTYADGRGVVMFGGFTTSANTHELTNELWSWDGSSWSVLGSLTTPPSPRARSAIAFVPGRGIVVFGGGVGEPPAPTNELWEWNGTWTRRLASGPPVLSDAAMVSDELGALLVGGTPSTPTTATTWRWTISGTWTDLGVDAVTNRFAHAMAYDTARHVAVVFGGTRLTAAADELADTLEHDARGWTVKAAASAPPARVDHVFVYDPARGEGVVFGGKEAITGLGSNLGDTWAWDGASWLERSRVGPANRHAAASAYDGSRHRVVLFGGRNPGNTFADTWEWDGVAWTEILPIESPPARWGAAMVYDAARAQLVMFGGARQNGPPNGETWTFAAGTWTQVVVTGPPARLDPQMVYVAKREVVVLHGGVDDRGVPLRDTWEWNGTTWSEIESASAPPPARTGAMFAYDPFRERPILTGGELDGAQLDDTWEWDGERWSELAPLVAPPRRSAAAMIYDEARRQLVRFGGSSGTSPVNDLSVRTYVSPGHDAERCERAIDTDGDGLAGCADPDCVGRCRDCGDHTCGHAEDYLICPADCLLP
ncbi:MAG: kelch repeat-containing protein [Kofleriaceae bacterium]